MKDGRYIITTSQNTATYRLMPTGDWLSSYYVSLVEGVRESYERVETMLLPRQIPGAAIGATRLLARLRHRFD